MAMSLKNLFFSILSTDTLLKIPLPLVISSIKMAFIKSLTVFYCLPITS